MIQRDTPYQPYERDTSTINLRFCRRWAVSLDVGKDPSLPWYARLWTLTGKDGDWRRWLLFDLSLNHVQESKDNLSGYVYLRMVFWIFCVYVIRYDRTFAACGKQRPLGGHAQYWLSYLMLANAAAMLGIGVGMQCRLLLGTTSVGLWTVGAPFLILYGLAAALTELESFYQSPDD